jgi:hypothetical protein
VINDVDAEQGGAQPALDQIKIELFFFSVISVIAPGMVV